MDTTIVIKVSQKEKLEALLAFLKSIDYISSIEYFDKLVEFKNKLDEVNKVAEGTSLALMTQEEIDEEIKAYRSGK
jgi:hypothetical protein